MVDTSNDNNSNDNTNGSAPHGESKRRSRLFGGRKKAAEQVPSPVVPDPTPADVPVIEVPAVSAMLPEAVATAAEPAATAPVAKAPTRRAPAKAPVQEAIFASDSDEQASTDAAAKRPAANRSRSKAGADAAVEPAASAPLARPSTSLLFQAPDLPTIVPPGPRQNARDGLNGRDGQNNRGQNGNQNNANGGNNRGNPNGNPQLDDESDEPGTLRRRSRRRSGEEDRDTNGGNGTPANTVVKVRTPRPQPELSNEPTKVRGSTRLEAKKQRRRDGRDAGRRRPVITESEFLARREAVDRVMVVRSKFERIQIGVLEDGVLVEHYVAKAADASLIGNVYLGRVQNVLPSMEAAFVDIGRGRNAVLYSGEVDWEAAAENSADGKSQARRIELALKPGDKVLVQVTKDPVGHKGARLTSQVSLPGRYLVYVPNGSMNGISRKLPDTERARLKKILKEVLPENVGVIVRTAAEGATEEQLTLDVSRLTAQWSAISAALENVQAPALLHSEPDLLVKIVRDVFNEDFHRLVIEGEDAELTIATYLAQVAPDLVDRVQKYEGSVDSFDEFRITEQIEKALDRKVWLPSGGSLVIDRTEAMSVVDVNTGKFVGSGGNLEETVTKNNLEAAEEIVRQLRLRDIGGIIVVDFIDMVLESNRDLVLRRLVECLSRDRTKHQVAEVTSLGLVQMTRKKLGLGLIESFSEPCDVCAGRGIVIHHDPVTKHRQSAQPEIRRNGRSGRGSNGDSNGGNGGNNGGNNGRQQSNAAAPKTNGTHAITADVKNALAQIAASTITTAAEIPTAVADAAASVSSTETPSAAEVSIPEVTAPEPVKSTNAAPTESAPPAEPLASEPVASDPVDVAHVAADAADAADAVAILDIPVRKAPRTPKRISSQETEQLLDSVLGALPEPKQPGQGRARISRRASSAGTVRVQSSEE